MLKYLTIGSIKFLTGSRAKAEYTYAEEDLFSLYRRSPPGKPLHLSDFKSIEVIAAGPLNLVMLAKCTFKDGEEATARVWYSIFEVIYIFTKNETNTSSEQPSAIFPKSYVIAVFLAILMLLYIMLRI